MFDVQKYGKAIVAVFVAGVVAAYQALGGDQHIDATEWVSVAIAAVTAFGVWWVPLIPNGPGVKTGVAVALAVLQVLTTAILGGVGTDEVLLMLITAAGAAGVWIAPASSTTSLGTVAVSLGRDR
ncbi:hypothetical protein [Actinoplanes sp. CA-252034]|uniref:hypothetical protein n=1 Tax=Actinoplanes sp. CA-252034 TaxID=3239906 RepID=UPI003D96A8ED